MIKLSIPTKLVALSLSRNVSLMLQVINTTTIALGKNIRMCSVLINGRASLARAKFSLERRLLKCKKHL